MWFEPLDNREGNIPHVSKCVSVEVKERKPEVDLKLF